MKAERGTFENLVINQGCHTVGLSHKSTKPNDFENVLSREDFALEISVIKLALEMATLIKMDPK